MTHFLLTSFRYFDSVKILTAIEDEGGVVRGLYTDS